MKGLRLAITLSTETIRALGELSRERKTSVCEQVRLAVAAHLEQAAREAKAGVITGIRQPADSTVRIDKRGEVLTDFDFGA